MELGIIPHVIDTVICIKAGKIEKVLEISLIVKIPTGMEDQDLARPVVEIRDFETKNLEYEIYTYGEENVIIPVSEEQETPLRKLAIKAVHDEMNKWDKNAQVEFLSDNRILVKVKNDVIPKLIGKGGKTIEEVEKRLGIHISVEPIEATMKHEIPFGLEETGAYFTLKIDNKFTGNQVDVYKNREFVFSPTVGKNGQISVKKNSDLGKRILQAVAEKKLKIFV
jgi:ATPase